MPTGSLVLGLAAMGGIVPESSLLAVDHTPSPPPADQGRGIFAWTFLHGLGKILGGILSCRRARHEWAMHGPCKACTFGLHLCFSVSV